MESKVNISCPQCGFSREVAEERLPKGATIATCPKCGCRFRLEHYQHASTNMEKKVSGRQPDGHSFPTEEELRQQASQAYEAEARRFEREKAQNARPRSWNPWDEAPGENGWLAAFYQTVIYVMFATPRFFLCLFPSAAKTRALVFYLAICLIQSIVEKLWSGVFMSMLASSAASDPQLEKMAAMLANNSNFVLNVLLRCGLLAFQLYILSFLMYLAYRLVAPGRATFSLVFQIMAYSAAPALLCIVPILGSIAGWIWSLVCLVTGCKAALDLDWPRTLLGILPLLLLFAPLLFQITGLLRQ